jgi:hypothetical protein
LARVVSRDYIIQQFQLNSHWDSVFTVNFLTQYFVKNEKKIAQVFQQVYWKHQNFWGKQRLVMELGLLSRPKNKTPKSSMEEP